MFKPSDFLGHCMAVGITEKEMDVIRLIVKGNTLTDACKALRIDKRTGSARLRRLKDRYLQSREFCDDYERWRAKMPGRFL